MTLVLKLPPLILNLNIIIIIRKYIYLTVLFAHTHFATDYIITIYLQQIKNDYYYWQFSSELYK